jgi:hypothetical protein
MQSKSRSRRGRKQGKPRKKRSAHAKWMTFMKKTYGVFDVKDGNGNRQIILTYGPSNIPPVMPRPLGPVSGAQLTVKQFVNVFGDSTAVSSGNITQNGVTAVLGQIAFLFNDLPQFSSFSALFDQYRFERVHLRIKPYNEAINLITIGTVNQALPSLFIVVDRDDGSAPTSIQSLQEYDNCQVITGSQAYDCILTPSLTPAVYSSGAFTGYEVADSTQHWVDIASTQVPFYGLKFGVTPLNTSTTAVWQWSVEAWFEVSFKNVR